jgi:hypothetical protein
MPELRVGHRKGEGFVAVAVGPDDEPQDAVRSGHDRETRRSSTTWGTAVSAATAGARGIVTALSSERVARVVGPAARRGGRDGSRGECQ